jgi:hypothetical protein
MNARPRETQLPIGPLVAAIGAVLLIVSLFLTWYGRYTGFEVFELIDLLLVALAVLTLASLLASLGLIRLPLRPGTPLGGAGLALVLVLTQLLNHPPAGLGRDVDTGLWLGLAGAALMVAGAILSSARIAIAVSPRERSAAPPAAAPPAATPRPPAPPAADEAPTIRDEPRP